MITYKDIIEELRTFCTAHLMVESFGHGLLADENGGKDIPYPRVFVRPSSSTRDNNTITYNLVIEIYSLVNYDADNIEAQEIQLLSDCDLIATDILSVIDRGTDYFYFDEEQPIIVGSPTIAPFIDTHAQRESGWIVNVAIQVHRVKNACDVPD